MRRIVVGSAAKWTADSRNRKTDTHPRRSKQPKRGRDLSRRKFSSPAVGSERLSAAVDGLARVDADSLQAASPIRSRDVYLRRIFRRITATLSRKASVC